MAGDGLVVGADAGHDVALLLIEHERDGAAQLRRDPCAQVVLQRAQRCLVAGEIGLAGPARRRRDPVVDLDDRRRPRLVALADVGGDLLQPGVLGGLEAVPAVDRLIAGLPDDLRVHHDDWRDGGAHRQRRFLARHDRRVTSTGTPLAVDLLHREGGIVLPVAGLDQCQIVGSPLLAQLPEHGLRHIGSLGLDRRAGYRRRSGCALLLRARRALNGGRRGAGSVGRPRRHGQARLGHRWRCLRRDADRVLRPGRQISSPIGLPVGPMRSSGSGSKPSWLRRSFSVSATNCDFCTLS